MMAAEVSRIVAPNAALSFRLAALRQQRGISLEQIAEATKISLRFLRAIEAENVEELPEGVFRISYIRQYANYIGIDDSDLLARFMPPAPKIPPEQAHSRNWFRKLIKTA
jgi:cytoskeletal protein RodZ